MPLPPSLTPDQRQAALEKAAAARRQRAELKEKLKMGSTSLKELLEQAQRDEVVGKMHTACDFDTPTLRGIVATAPYFHDGSAATLTDVVNRYNTARQLGLTEQQRRDLVEYLKTL